MRPDQPPAEERLPYEKPWIQVIPLKPVQLLSSGCKTTGSTVFARGEPECGLGVPCYGIGS